MTHRCCSVLLALLIGVPAMAHESLPHSRWCSQGQLSVVRHVSFSAQQIQNYADCGPAAACTVAPLPPLGGRPVAPPPLDCTQVVEPEPATSCGIFDDDYALARKLTDTFCTRYARTPEGTHVADWGSVVTDVLNPAIFYDEFQHHQYQRNLGLELTCIRCEDPAAPVQ